MVVCRTSPPIIQIWAASDKAAIQDDKLNCLLLPFIQSEDTITIPITWKAALSMWKTLTFQQSESRDYLLECCNKTWQTGVS